MKATNNQLFLAACNLMSNMIQPSESAAYTDNALVKRAVKIAKMVADELPDDDNFKEDFLDDNQICETIATAFENVQNEEMKSSQLNMELRKLTGCKYRSAIAYIQRAEQLGVLFSRKEGQTFIYTRTSPQS